MPIVPRRGLWIAGGLCIAISLYFLSGSFFGAKTPMKPQGSAAPVRTAKSLVQDVPRFLTGLGTVLPSSDVLVRSRVSGQLIALHFQEGQRVQAGTLLAEIDPRQYEAQLAEAKGRLAADQAQLANARRDLSRYASLVKSDYVERQKYDTQKALVSQYEGAVRADQAACETARLQVEYSRITAPAGGVAGLRKVDVGNQISASDSEGIVRITEVSPCDVLFTLPETVISDVVSAFQGGKKQLLVQAWDREQKHLLARGTLLSLDNQIDRETGTVRLKARFENADKSLYANQFVNARLCVAVEQNALTIPLSAVQIGSKGHYVYVVTRDMAGGDSSSRTGAFASGRCSLRFVETGLETPRFVVVKKGLSAGEEVVVDGLDRLRDGAEVRLAGEVQTDRAEQI